MVIGRFEIKCGAFDGIICRSCKKLDKEYTIQTVIGYLETPKMKAIVFFCLRVGWLK